MAPGMLPLAVLPKGVCAVVADIHVHPVEGRRSGIVQEASDAGPGIEGKHGMGEVVLIVGPDQLSAASSLGRIVGIREVSPVHHAVGSAVIVRHIHEKQLRFGIGLCGIRDDARHEAGPVKVFGIHPGLDGHLIDQAPVVQFFYAFFSCMEMEEHPLLSGHAGGKDHLLLAFRDQEDGKAVLSGSDGLGEVLLGLIDRGADAAVPVAEVCHEGSVEDLGEVLVGFCHQVLCTHLKRHFFSPARDAEAGLIVGDPGQGPEIAFLPADFLLDARQFSGAGGHKQVFRLHGPCQVPAAGGIRLSLSFHALKADQRLHAFIRQDMEAPCIRYQVSHGIVEEAGGHIDPGLSGRKGKTDRDPGGRFSKDLPVASLPFQDGHDRTFLHHCPSLDQRQIFSALKNEHGACELVPAVASPFSGQRGKNCFRPVFQAGLKRACGNSKALLFFPDRKNRDFSGGQRQPCALVIQYDDLLFVAREKAQETHQQEADASVRPEGGGQSLQRIASFSVGKLQTAKILFLHVPSFEGQGRLGILKVQVSLIKLVAVQCYGQHFFLPFFL